MRHASSARTSQTRPWTLRRLTAILLGCSLAASTPPWRIFAQEALSCSVNGFCLSGNLTNLLGLPNGTLNIVGYEPWDHVVQLPKAGIPLAPELAAAASAWVPLEAEARAFLSALHGVPNDFRLPHTAASDVRTTMLLRLVAIAKKQADGSSLTNTEADALDAFVDLIVARRVLIAQKAVDEYRRWESDPCHYTVPVMPDGRSFGFEQYDPGPGCGLPGASLAGPPRPPTADQFKAYGAAVALAPFISGDRDAALRQFDESLAVAVAVLSAALVAGVAAVLAVSSTAVAGTVAAMVGSAATFAFFSSSLVSTAGAFVSLGIVGASVAASVPAFIIIAAVVAAVYVIQFTEDQSVFPELAEALHEAHHRPSVWSMSQDPVTYGELVTTFLIPTSPDWTDEERAGAAAAMLGPSQRGPGDPRFLVDGTLQDTIVTRNADGALQETFMSQGWFVTRTRGANNAWGPWQWKLTLSYRSGVLQEQLTRIAGIQPAGFIDARRSDTGLPPPAVKTAQLFILDETFQSKTVTWAGNRSPVLAPTVSQQPTVGVPVLFKANASEPDANDTVVAIRWYIEDPTFDPIRKSFDECSFTPPRRVDPLTGFVYQCPWKLLEDNAGAGVQYVYARPGTWGVRVMALDSEGGVGSQQFTVNIGNLAPELVITQIPFFALPPDVPTVAEGQEASITGTVNYPGLGDGSWGALTTLVIDWGDGQVTKRAYPCSAATLVDSDQTFIPSDRTCLIDVGSGGAAFRYVPVPGDPPLPTGPWAFSMKHVYTHRPDTPIPTPAQVKVYAVTTLNSRSDTMRYSVTVVGVAPIFESAPICEFIPFGGVPPFFLQCVRAAADHRTVPLGASVDLRGRIYDLSGATHFVKVLWGDGTSSAHPAGCTAPGCPGFETPWLNATTSGDAFAPKYLGFTHRYETTGTYNVTLEVNDGAANGKATYTTAATVFGVTTPSGPIDVRAGEAVTYTYSSLAPAGFTAEPTPTCEGGTATNLTPSSFSCVFDDVGAATPAKVKLSAVIAGYTFDHELDVTVRPRATTISPLDGPTVVTAGTVHTYTFTASFSPLGGFALFAPSCGQHATMPHSSNTSITCRFNAVTSPSETKVGVSVSAPGGSATSSLAVTVLPDTAPPVLSLPGGLVRNSTSHLGAVVTFGATAEDVVSGPAAVTCTPQSGAVFAIGTSTVSCAAGDWVGNVAHGSFQVTVIDVTPPTLSLPPSQVLDATGPSGAVATFVATASDAVPANPPVTCLPPSGSTFPIGTTTVGCAATDAAGNLASGQFTITVQGPLQQIDALEEYVGSLDADVTAKTALAALLKSAETAVAADRPNACSQLAAVAKLAAEVRGSKLTAEQVDRILKDVARIRAVLGC